MNISGKRRFGGGGARWGAALTLALLLAAGCGKAETDGQAPEADPAPVESSGAPVEGVIVAMGDSLTEGYGVAPSEAYPAALERRLRAAGYNFEVVNAGVAGETSRGARSRAEWVLNLEPDIVILETGANDGLRGVDPAATRENIRAVVDVFQKNGVVVVLAGMRMVRNMGREFTEKFRAIYADVAAETGVPLVPFFLEGVALEPKLNQEDGIHPNAQGYEKVVDNLFPTIRQAIQRWRAAEGISSDSQDRSGP